MLVKDTRPERIHKEIEKALGDSITGIQMIDLEDKNTWNVIFRDNTTWAFGEEVKTPEQQIINDIILAFDEKSPAPKLTIQEKLDNLDLGKEELKDYLDLTAKVSV